MRISDWSSDVCSSDLSEVLGVYGAVAEIASVLRKSRAAFDPIMMPIAQRLHITHDHAGLQRETTRAVGWALQIGLGVLGVMVIMPNALLGLFGADFTGPLYAHALIALATGQVVYMSLGLSEGILAITGYGYEIGRASCEGGVWQYV